MNRLFFMLFTLLLISLSVKVSNADVIFVDQAGANRVNAAVAFMELEVPATSGEEGEFEILACVTQSVGPNLFTEATPDWDNLNLGGCGGGPNCIMGIFNKFSPEPNNIQSTCSWNTPTNRASGVVLRYSGVSGFVPVFNVVCNTDISKFATSPSINAPEGSMVIRVFGANGLVLPAFVDLPGSLEFGKEIKENGNAQSAIGVFTYGEPFPDGGTAEEVSIEYVLVDTAWRACTISLLMEGGIPKNVPTLNEWGLIIFALAVGLSGLWFIRRRSITA